MIRTMIVEDDPMVAEFNKRYIGEIKGFQLVAVSSTVDAAIDVIEKQPVDLILLDIFMPGKNGLELLIYLRENEMDIDVIMISAASDIERIQKAIRYGVVDYLIKPFEFERLNKTLTAYKEKARFIQDQRVVNQKELDQQFFNMKEMEVTEDLPKGLTNNTLEQVWEAISTLKEEQFSTEDIVKVVGISRVSVRKYLKFLTDIGVLRERIIYGTVGRPVYQYEINKSEEHLIKKFL
ncbi:response regulator [Niallia oryzisoli]|uniref:Response regulator n=1 Tax=Niallia oryzisoli TaxID=1737571 RepID=A0ABZ2CDF3_9BACI